MKRPWPVWIAFSGCLAVVLAATGWVSLTALGLDQAEQAARRQAALEENMRLALWRMDSSLAPVIAQESARPYFTYSAFLPADRIYGQVSGDRASAMLLPSPLLGEPPAFVLVHFQFDPVGRLTSPRVPPEAQRGLAVPRYLSEEAARKAQEQLDHVAATIDRNRLIAMLPGRSERPAEPIAVPGPLFRAGKAAQEHRRSEAKVDQGAMELFERNRAPSPMAAAASARRKDDAEYVERNRALLQNATIQSQVFMPEAPSAPPLLRSEPVPRREPPLRPAEVSGVLMTPLWLDGQLVLARRVTIGGREYVQGCLLDWPAIRTWLLASVDDLLPEAELMPVTAAGSKTESHMLAALPVRLISGRVARDMQPVRSPVRMSLMLAWAGLLAAAAAVAALLWGVVRLSERRAAFVSAVTHELRTPLTTFHMYTEMLTEGMVPQSQQQDYLRTLRREASRLSHLVENVLAYARLERGRPGGPLQRISVAEMLEPIRARLAERTSQAGMELVFDATEEALSTPVQASPSIVEQILFNLVDNACKYAAGAADKRIHLAVRRQGRSVQVQVRDHGPGIARRTARRMLRPFFKSAKEAANTAPGVGLGLALSRRLARDMGARLLLSAGSLTAETTSGEDAGVKTAGSQAGRDHGACLTLTMAVVE
jgi:signal transduction histidine kinase